MLNIISHQGTRTPSSLELRAFVSWWFAVFGSLFFWIGAANAADPIELEVACFKGGYGIDFYERRAREFETSHPELKINVWGNPKIMEQLVPRFASGDPPDLVWPGPDMNVWALVFDGQIMPLDTYLDQPAIGLAKPWRDTFIQSMLKKGAKDGHNYTLPYNFDTFGWWYNKKMFQEHGWKPPQTYDELLALCDEIKKTPVTLLTKNGPVVQHETIAPITFTGRIAQYMLDGLYFPYVFRVGGQKVLDRVDQLEPGAWKDPAFITAAKTLLEMKHRGCFERGAIGMNHVESQMEFVVGRAAMVPNGSWLYSEMKNVLPPGFEMEFFLTPTYSSGVGPEPQIGGAFDGNGWFVPSKAKHQEQAVEFLRYLTSPAVAAKFITEKGTLMSIADATANDLPPHLREPMRLLKEIKAERNVHYAAWYPELGAAVQNAIRDLYNEFITPEQFVDQIENAAAILRADPNRKKFSGQ